MRNQLLHNGGHIDIMETSQHIKKRTMEYAKTLSKEKSLSKDKSLNGWEAPKKGWIKLNVDAVVSENATALVALRRLIAPFRSRKIVKMKGAKGKGAARNSREALKPVDDRKVGKRKAVVKVDKSSKRQAKKPKSAKKDPNKPKRPPSAFFVFLEEFRKEYKKEHPEVKAVSAIANITLLIIGISLKFA
nr:isoform 2 of high mobility group b protein 1 [Quercus suber]